MSSVFTIDRGLILGNIEGMEQHAQLHKTMRELRSWDIEELEALREFLSDLLREREKQAREPIPVRAGREVVEERPHREGRLRLEFVKCGKEHCHCRSDRGHGPYWYSYSRRGSKVISKYIGKKL